MLYINVIDMQIRKGCSIEFLSIRVIFGSWRIYKENVRRARLMRRSLQVKYNKKSSCFVCYRRSAIPPTHPQSKLIPITFQLLIYIISSRKDRLLMNLLCL
jgi:hypothetical protein